MNYINDNWQARKEKNINIKIDETISLKNGVTLMKIVTFNLRCPWDEIDGGNTFVSRAGAILNKITDEMPDIICFQEATERSVAFLRKYLNEYYILFNSRESNLRGEGLAVAYNKNKLEIFGMDVFWLSDTPKTAGSRYQNQSNCPRVCQVALFRSNSNRLFRICNVHLDHRGEGARLSAIRQIAGYFENTADAEKTPYLIMGDFNAKPDSEVIEFCNKSGMTDLTEKIETTFHKFGAESRKIDYIFAGNFNNMQNISVAVWDDSNKENGRYLSDHYPICLSIDI